MKHFAFLILVASMLFVVAGCGSGLLNSTPEQLGESIYLSVKNDNFDGYRSLYPTAADVDEIVEKQVGEGSPEEKAEARERAEEQLSRTDARAQESFGELRSDMQEAGFDIEASAWEGVEVKKREAEKNIEVVDIKLFFKEGDRTGTILVRGAGKLSRGWLLDRSPRFELYNGE